MCGLVSVRQFVYPMEIDLSESEVTSPGDGSRLSCALVCDFVFSRPGECAVIDLHHAARVLCHPVWFSTVPYTT